MTPQEGGGATADAVALYEHALRVFADAAEIYRSLASLLVPSSQPSEPTSLTDALAPAIRESQPTSCGTGAPAATACAPISLTPRQIEVAALLARGYTNAQIAECLVVTRGTVANHVALILKRLGLKRRTEVAVWATRHGLLDLYVSATEKREGLRQPASMPRAVLHDMSASRSGEMPRSGVEAQDVLPSLAPQQAEIELHVHPDWTWTWSPGAAARARARDAAANIARGLTAR